MHIAAALLDPRLKNKLEQKGISEAQLLRATALLHDLPSIKEKPLERTFNNANPSKKQKTHHSLYDESDYEDEDAGREGKPDQFNMEFNRYLQCEYRSYPGIIIHQGEFCILSWWKNQQKVFPLLSRCARDVLSIQASSAQSERNFSESGNIITEKRSSLHPETVSNLTLIRGNRDLIPDNN